MRRALSRSLRVKLTSVVLLTTLAALVVALVAIVVYDLRIYRRNWEADLSTQAELLGRTAAPAVAFDDPKAAGEDLDLLRLRPRVQVAAIYTARGELFASYARPGAPRDFPKLPESDGMRVEGRSMVLFRRIVRNNEIVGTVYLRADYEMLQRIGDYLGIAAIVAVVAMLVAFGLSSWLQRIVTAPILDIVGIAREVVQLKDYSRRARKTSEDEVGVLVDSFNGMLEEIGQRTHALEVSNAELEREIAGHAKAQREIMRLNTELEDRVRDRTARLESANRELEAFSFSVSHDLRAPLRHIQGYAQMLQEDAAQLDPDMRRYLDMIRESARRMGLLIDDLLAFSRLGRQALEKTAVDMNALVESTLREVGVAGSDDPRLRVARLPTVDGDRNLLRQVWVNLLSNAFKYSATRSEAARVEVSGERDGAVARFHVHDNGVGFDMRYADKLFGVFQRLHSQDQFEGTGVGLAIVQRIVARHGGRVWAEAEIDRGATFTFELPARPASTTENIA
ncbi:MAG TPA: ATP-binding protein [Xanthomonadaceae bacterium]|jgi:signal transduction histidine kinase